MVPVFQSVADRHRVCFDELQEVQLDRWWRLPVFVVGHAVHAMTPNVGQGANAAMVDALALMQLLAPALRSGGDLEEVGRYTTGCAVRL